eukprot:TRINITY_DN22432_c0_g3_i2.p1 TRINITY_DN22432_c0_g3~~TRINITY_DN22432_c0_g3_i2.p1  ORF type:complete len:405 (+),score=46.16 TRINITY_DN22432_c0_g3_i2:76-1290(+)
MLMYTCMRLSCLLVCFFRVEAADDDVMIELEPIAGDPPPAIMDLLSKLGNRDAPGPALMVPSDISPQGREAQIDGVMQDVISHLFQSGGPLAGAGPTGVEEGGFIIDGPVASDSQVPVSLERSFGNSREPRRHSVSPNMIRELFPGPFVVNEQLEHPLPFDTPDRFMQSMVDAMDKSFREEMLPEVHRAASVGRAPKSCQVDVRYNCLDMSSWLKCLGKHPDALSEACKKDVGKSVPFLCSKAIDRYCDVLEGGIIPCLEGHMTDLDDACRDAVFATRSLIDKLNTHKASLLDAANGTRKVVVPTTAAPVQREADLDRRLSHVGKVDVALEEPAKDVRTVVIPAWLWSFHPLTVLLVIAFVVCLAAFLRLGADMNLSSYKSIHSGGKESTRLLGSAEIPNPVQA